ncbi:MAG: replication initiation and membrane attachment family protein [Bacillus sp. (in: firmicutes)]
MINHWQQLLPVDQYRVTSKGILSDYDRKIITLLYQPLIGPLSVSLYMTLWSEMETNRLWSKPSNHYNLMNILGLPLSDIYEARKKLEGIGLAKVYRKKNAGEDYASIVYELMAPLTPEQFFTDGMLNIYLYKKVGKGQFGKLKRFFCDEGLDVSEYEDVTMPFPDVFSSTHADSLYIDSDSLADLAADEGQVFVGKAVNGDLDGFEEHFDFQLFFAGMGSALISESAFDRETLTAIAKLAFIYGINPLAMQSIVLSAFDGDSRIDLEELRKAARNWYQIEYNETYPSLSVKVQPAKYRTAAGQPQTQEEERIHHLEQISPRELLIQHSGGGEPSKADLQIIEEVMLKQKLTPGVMNVLLEYVMIMTDMKLSKAYVEKIASHWARKGVKTVKEAMELARTEYRQTQERAAKTKQPYTKNNQKPTRTEIVPEWLKEGKNNTAAQSEEDESFLMEVEELQAKLKKKYNAKG